MRRPGFPSPRLTWLVALALCAVLAACGGAKSDPNAAASRPTPAGLTATAAPTASPTASPQILASLSAEPGATPTTGAATSAEGELTLRVGEEAPLGPDGASVRFERVVEDSRCPAGARCIWQGRVVVVLSVTGAGAATSLTLGTLKGFADAPTEAQAGGVTLSIAGVEPYPDASGRIPADQYVLTLAVR